MLQRQTSKHSTCIHQNIGKQYKKKKMQQSEEKQFAASGKSLPNLQI
jgi:hypothetical protein